MWEVKKTINDLIKWSSSEETPADEDEGSHTDTWRPQAEQPHSGSGLVFFQVNLIILLLVVWNDENRDYVNLPDGVQI